MPDAAYPNNNNMPAIQTNLLQKMLKEINRLVGEDVDFDQEQAFQFCCKYLAAHRKINELSQSSLPKEQAYAKQAKQDLLSDKLKRFGGYPKNRVVFLKQLVMCKERLLSHHKTQGIADYQLELTWICEEHLSYIQQKPDGSHDDQFKHHKHHKHHKHQYYPYYPYLDIKVVFSILLFASPKKALAYFFAKEEAAQKAQQLLLLALLKIDCHGAFVLILRLFDQASVPEKQALLPYLGKTLDKIKKEGSAQQIYGCSLSYCQAVMNMPANTQMNVDDTNRLVDCLLEPGIGVSETTLLIQFLSKANKNVRIDVLRQLYAVAQARLAEDAVSENTTGALGVLGFTIREKLSIYVKSLPAKLPEQPKDSVCFRESSVPAPRAPSLVETSPDFPCLVASLIIILAKPRPKLSRWTCFLIWLGVQEPTPTEFNEKQIQQLICCAPLGSVCYLLDFFPLTANSFLALINNPALCSDNRKLLLEKFFANENVKLRAEVYEKLKEKPQNVPLTVVQQWILPLGRSKETTGFLAAAFRDRGFQEGCKQLALEGLVSLQQIYFNNCVEGVPITLSNFITEKMSPPSVSSAKPIDASSMEFSSGAQRKHFLSNLSFLFGQPKAEGFDRVVFSSSFSPTPVSSAGSSGQEKSQFPNEQYPFARTCTYVQ